MSDRIELPASLRDVVHSLDLEGVMRSAHANLDAIEALREEKEAHFSVGGNCASRVALSSGIAGGGLVNVGGGDGACAVTPDIPGCFRGGQRICDVQHISRAIVVAGGTPFALQMEPTSTSWFEPFGVRATVIDLANADVAHRVLIGGVAINTRTQEPTFTNPIVAPVVAGDEVAAWWSDIWTAPDGCACDVGWGAFSNQANNQSLVINGFALGYPVTTLLLVEFTIYGNSWNAQPPMYVGTPCFERQVKHRELNIAQCYQMDNGIPAGSDMPGAVPSNNNGTPGTSVSPPAALGIAARTGGRAL